MYEEYDDFGDKCEVYYNELKKLFSRQLLVADTFQ